MKLSWKMFSMISCLFISLLLASLSQAAQIIPAIQQDIYLPLIFNNFTSKIGELAFIVTNPNNYEQSYIYRADEKGNNLINLTIDPTSQLYFVWSADGSKIAFNSFWGDDDNIYIMNADGSSLTQLTTEPASDEFPSWSGDGAHIAFQSRRSGSSQIYVMAADGSGVLQLSDLPNGCTRPIWAPVGNKIAFNRFGSINNDEEIYVVNSDGSGLSNLTNNAFHDTVQDWSPDGEQILFVSNRDLGGVDGYNDLYVMNSDGSDPVRLTTSGYVESSTWSPDGTKIAYSQINGPAGLFIINPDGSNAAEVQCQSAPISSWSFSWSPDGTKIAFTPFSFTPETRGVYIARVDDSSCSHISSLMAVMPKWRPVP